MSGLKVAEAELLDSDYVWIYDADLGLIDVTGDKELEDQYQWVCWSSASKAVTCTWPLAQDGHLKGCLNWFTDMYNKRPWEDFMSVQPEINIISHVTNPNMCKPYRNINSVIRIINLHKIKCYARFQRFRK